MLILWDHYSGDKPPILARAFGFIHTIEVFWPWHFSAELKNALRAETGRLVWDDPLIIDGNFVGWILKLNAPTKRAIKILDAMWEPRMSTCRLHVAYDLDPAPGISRADIRTLMTRYSYQKYRKASDRIRKWDDTVYGTDTAYRSGRLSRNWTYYDDEPGELDGECEKPHYEIRVLSGAAVKRAGFHRPADLLTIKPREFFRKCTTIRDHAEREIRRLMRTTKPSPFIDIPRRVTGLFRRLEFTLSDFRRDCPKAYEKLQDLQVLNICEDLHWVPAKGREKEKGWGKFCILSHQKTKPGRQQKGRRKRL